MLAHLPQVWQFFLSICRQVTNILINNPVISAFFALLILDRVTGFFDNLKN